MGRSNIVQNNLIHHIDYMANDAAGVNISGTGHSIKNNTIYASGRDSIFIKKAYWPNGTETYSNNNDISYNNLFNAMMLSIDAGAIYTGGAGMPPLTGVRIHHNWIHDTQSWIQYTQSLYSGPTYNYGYVGIYLDMFAGGLEIDQNIFWNNQFHSIQVLSDGTGGSEPYPNNNNVHNNSIIDVSSKSSIFIQDISNCGSTQIVNNYVLVPVEVDNSSCTVSNNSSAATGANEMTSSVQVGCNFTGCSSSNPPAVSGGLVSASIATQPYSVTVSAGQSATFRVTGAGSPTLTYQWQKNGVNISGATSATYTTPVTTSADNGTVFTVQVSNSVGSVTSNQATLTVRGGTTGYTLSVTKSGTGTGTVTASSGTLTWSGSTGTASYTSGTPVTLTAAASSGSTFTSWSGCDSTSGSSCTVTMSAAKSVTAAFTSGISDSDAASAAFTAIYNQYASWFGATSGGIQTGTSWIAYYQLYSNGAYLVAATDGNIYLYYNGQLSGLGAAWQSLGKAATKITAIYNQYASWFGSTSGSIYIGTSSSAAYYVQWFTNGAAVVAWTDGYLYTYYNGTSYALGVSWQ
ncbi:MAG: hypothetical protein HQK99_04255 [Nitrospirae bacterium]|nr:hypothetical protein [Nitrospirota bacterium]